MIPRPRSRYARPWLRPAPSDLYPSVRSQINQSSKHGSEPTTPMRALRANAMVESLAFSRGRAVEAVAPATMAPRSLGRTERYLNRAPEILKLSPTARSQLHG